ncbi:DUF1840 domain-containing protein [Rhabdochromatium marinum]|uniref:DUF1840 domain-containing protein n=1 Tax=Rhabdochromatium marinum TaxID=48729 RepID=UPI0019043E26|nr:DUF1840 domain-containing protein [Rhabdochromatium marinum]MBK1647474.1 hypothetical protein [Rhabdochromatium marinum]
MLVKFQSPAHANILMFGDVAITLLRLMGNSGKIPGALMPEDIPEALDNLKAAVAANPERPLNPKDVSRDREQPSITLAHRALPLIGLLETALARDAHVIWE